MSLQSMLMPTISGWLLSRERVLKRRARAERERVRAGKPHQVLYFHQVDDPYSALTAACLNRLLNRYDIILTPHLVGPPPDNAAPAREQLVAYSRRDAQLLAQRWGLDFADPGAQPSPHAVLEARCLLLGSIQGGSFAEAAPKVSAALWAKGSPGLTGLRTTLNLPAAVNALTRAHLEQHHRTSGALRERLGHYLGATFFYGGEWYWGLDRLHHLEQRLRALGADRSPGEADLFPLAADITQWVPKAHPPPIDFYVSLRSPYSAIVAERVFALGRLTGADVRLKYVLPMVMRGLPVPRIKRTYISQDAAREAHARGIPFGRLNDPVGRPTERGLALIPLAERSGKAQAYLLSFMHGVWAEGLDAGSDKGLRAIVERCGLDWSAAQEALRDEGWRVKAEQHRAELWALGLWGVPSFRVRDTAVWGQDRLWAIEAELAKET